ncbi:MAG TPA: pentapeptide repeat-containing protein [Anaerolineaceae bacterium]|nr:pentapeptide repeat-containing protein [Anaerolineaceae bacterium]
MDLSQNNQREFDAQEFRGLVHPQIDLSQRTFTGCTFMRCNFRETVFKDCRFRECTFKHCDLSLANLAGCVLGSVRLEDCSLVGVNWIDVAWGQSKLFKPLEFFRCALNHASFSGLDLKKIQMVKCTAHDVDFSDADLSQANCRGTDFANSRFVHSNLSEADFREAHHYVIAPHLNTLKKTRFSLPEAESLLYNLDILLEEEPVDG